MTSSTRAYFPIDIKLLYFQNLCKLKLFLPNPCNFLSYLVFFGKKIACCLGITAQAQSNELYAHSSDVQSDTHPMPSRYCPLPTQNRTILWNSKEQMNQPKLSTLISDWQPSQFNLSFRSKGWCFQQEFQKQMFTWVNIGYRIKGTDNILVLMGNGHWTRQPYLQKRGSADNGSDHVEVGQFWETTFYMRS